MAFIPGVTNIEPSAQNHQYEALDPKNKSSFKIVKNNAKKHHHRDEQPQFDIDI
ncbi:hypothetical protein BLA29_015408 [Euroglyphus maynei]|uniref:Uncharacterized protein n=1 Tax=Euroglyphus maynei TaxID=6958 RepID=A0A1Y3BNQ2_EURMA|nr:hypothetical protein BLA29_015408 [Euroglyphus maynei]